MPARSISVHSLNSLSAFPMGLADKIIVVSTPRPSSTPPCKAVSNCIPDSYSRKQISVVSTLGKRKKGWECFSLGREDILQLCRKVIGGVVVVPALLPEMLRWIVAASRFGFFLGPIYRIKQESKLFSRELFAAVVKWQSGRRERPRRKLYKRAAAYRRRGNLQTHHLHLAPRDWSASSPPRAWSAAGQGFFLVSWPCCLRMPFLLEPPRDDRRTRTGVIRRNYGIVEDGVDCVENAVPYDTVGRRKTVVME